MKKRRYASKVYVYHRFEDEAMNLLNSAFSPKRANNQFNDGGIRNGYMPQMGRETGLNGSARALGG